MRNRWRVAVIDSGIEDRLPQSLLHRTVVAARRFSDDGQRVWAGPTVNDPIGHGTAVLEAICSEPDEVELLIAQVLDHRGLATAAAVAAAIDWATETGAGLIHMSLGLREDRRVLRAAVSAAVSAGRIIVASAPARGTLPFPSGYPEVLRATGDARCEPGEISALSSHQADFGGCPRLLSASQWPAVRRDSIGGASVGAAHVTGFIVGRVAPGSDFLEVRDRLTELSRYRGMEKRSASKSAAADSAGACK